MPNITQTDQAIIAYRARVGVFSLGPMVAAARSTGYIATSTVTTQVARSRVTIGNTSKGKP